MFTCSSNDEEICEGIFAFYKRGFFSGGGGAPQLITELNLTTSAILNRGTVSPDFTRATAASLLDFESLMKESISGEIRFSGARRVYNLLANSNNLDDGAWDTFNVSANEELAISLASNGFFRQITNSGNPEGMKFAVSVYARIGNSNSLRIATLGSASGLGFSDDFFTLSSDYVRFEHETEVFGAGGDNLRVRIHPANLDYPTNDRIYAKFLQAENISGQDVEVVGDYVSNSLSTSPYHGAGVDGVKYFNYENGNTVDGSGVVTEATGDPISESLLLGYLCEIGRTKLSLHSLDFSNAAWVTSNLSVTTDQLVGKKGLTDADVLTADAANATILQTISSASANRVFTLWLKRKTGTGNIDLTIDGGTTWQNITDDISSLVRVEIKQSAVTNPVFGVRIVTSGDEVYAWGANLENGDFATSFVETAATAVSRNPDQLSYPNDSYKFLPNEFTFAVTVRPLTSGANYTNNEVRLFGTDDSGGVNDEVRTIGGGAYGYTHATGGGYFTLDKSDLVGDQNVRFLLSLSQEGSDVRAIVYKDGVEKLNTTTAGTLSHSDTSVGIGHYAGDYFSGNFKNIKIWSGKLADAKLISESTL